ncbi:UNVERIFIED_CONTAM: hypothetical protein FKN15_000554, partial [Acipenser sinensis]
IVLRNSHLPPILQSTSWTLAVPFKEQRHHRSPSESIGNNYTPSASNLKIKDLQKKFPYRYLHYLNTGVHSHMLVAQDQQQMKNVLQLLPHHLKNKTDLEKLQEKLTEEIHNDYDFSLRKSIVSAELCIVFVLLLSALDLLFTFHYRDGNDFGEEYKETDFFKPQIMIVKLKVKEPAIVFEPSMRECWGLINRCFMEIMSSAEGLPRVECDLFPEIQGESLCLRAVKLDEPLVCDIVNKTLEIFKKNTVGPQIYLNVYKKYSDLLNSKAEQDVISFLKENHSLQAFTKKIEGIHKLQKEIGSLHITVPLAVFCLDAVSLNVDLCVRAEKLKERLILFEVDENRELNKSVCRRYDEIAEKISTIPNSTEEMVALTEYLKVASEVTVHKLKDEIYEAASRLEFLMEYATLSYEDVKLNSCVFYWPDQIQAAFELNRSRLAVRREHAEESLLKKISEFDKKLVVYNKGVESFRKKELMSTEEMKNNVDKLSELTSSLDTALAELEDINKEEALLEREQSQFPLLQTTMANKQPYDQLWTTAYNFHTKSEFWLNGPFLKLNAEDINEEIENMWRTVYKLTKTLSDLPGPRRVADSIKLKIDKFKQYLPILSTICNPGIKQRHWEKISEIVGFDLKPEADTSLLNMVEYGLAKFIDKLDEIGASASKEYSLEKAMEKMKSEWADACFGFTKYRDTGTQILSAVDDIQVLLDDHVIKAQTMRGSPYIKPIETECKISEIVGFDLKPEADTSLLNMVEYGLAKFIDKLDEIGASASKEYSLEKAMEKMKSEWADACFGFTKYRDTGTQILSAVDDIQVLLDDHVIKAQTMRGSPYIKPIETECKVKDTRVLVATAQPNMLGRLQESNALLEDIQKGLNTYLEKKRLFFPRFFFLSNDELLEILSETKDPLRVQPHLKKCFEGIAKLEFTDNMEITGMISSEKEMVQFVKKIYPAKAKGMVEKWLQQVEETMLSSVRQVIQDGTEGYIQLPRKKWVLQWPGQVVICVSSIYWTKEVSEAIQQNTLLEYLKKSNEQISEIVELVRGKLPGGARMTLGALTVIDVHARDVVAKLAQGKVSSLNDFQWISQLRYYWLDSDVKVQMITTEVKYGYEYLGNSPRLVITPLTDRCYRTLMGALKLNLGGAPEGPAGTGKTETTKDLAKALAKQLPWLPARGQVGPERRQPSQTPVLAPQPPPPTLHQPPPPETSRTKLMDEFAVEYRIINPKAITMGQLYGCFDPVSHEWTDGVLATTFRDQACSTSEDRQWIIFDGPVDAVWIENMNTVLDDNKKLCLMSGEIIQMSTKMSLIFEPADLEQASPATVSRCGMIYMEPHQLGWSPLRDSYMDTLPQTLSDEHRELINDMFNWLVQPSLEFIRHECKFLVQTSPIHLAYSMMRLYTCLLDEVADSGKDGKEPMSSQQITLWLQGLFLFAVVWTIGGTISGESRKKFDVFYRNVIMGMDDKNPRPKSVKLTKNNVFPERDKKRTSQTDL